MSQELLSSGGVVGFSGAFGCLENVAEDVSRQQAGQKACPAVLRTPDCRGSRAEWTYPKDTGQAEARGTYCSEA